MGKLLHLLDTSWGNSKVLQRCGNVLIESSKQENGSAQGRVASSLSDVPGDASLKSSGAPLRNLRKDLGFICDTADKLELNLEATRASLAMYELLEDTEDCGGSDMSLAYYYLQKGK